MNVHVPQAGQGNDVTCSALTSAMVRIVKRQTEAEVVPSSSFVEVLVEVEVEVGVEVGIEVGVEVGV